MITREQVADLRVGDVVEFTSPDWPDAVVRGPVREKHHGLFVGPVMLLDRNMPGVMNSWAAASGAELRVVSGAPRPLYVNHDRTEPVPGDVARDEEDRSRLRVWSYTQDGWQSLWMHHLYGEVAMPRLRLLVDGTTGEVVR